MQADTRRWLLVVAGIVVSVGWGCTINESLPTYVVERPEIGRDAAGWVLDADATVDDEVTGAPSGTPPGSIAPARPAGEACVEALDCAAGLDCRWGRCTPGCTLHDECLPGRCDAHGRCVPGPDGARVAAMPPGAATVVVHPARIRLGADARARILVETTGAEPIEARVVLEGGGGDLWLAKSERGDVLGTTLDVSLIPSLPVSLDIVSVPRGERRPTRARLRVVSHRSPVEVDVVRQPAVDGRYAGALVADDPLTGATLPIALEVEIPMGVGKPRGRLLLDGTPWATADRPLCVPEGDATGCDAPVPPALLDEDGRSSFAYRFVVRERFDSALLGDLASWWLLLDLTPSDPPGAFTGRFRLGFDHLPASVGWSGEVTLALADELSLDARPPAVPPALAPDLTRASLEETCPAEAALPGDETYIESWLEGLTAARCLAGDPCPMPPPWVPDGPPIQSAIWERLQAQHDASADSLAGRCCVRVESTGPGDPGLWCAVSCSLPSPVGLDPEAGTAALAEACRQEIGPAGTHIAPGPRARPAACLDLARVRCARRLFEQAAARRAGAPEDEAAELGGEPEIDAAALMTRAWALWAAEWDAARLTAGAALDPALGGAADDVAHEAGALIDRVWRARLGAGLLGPMGPGGAVGARPAVESAAAAAVYRLAVERAEPESAVAAERLVDGWLTGALAARLVVETCPPADAEPRCVAARRSMATHALLLEVSARSILAARAAPIGDCGPGRLLPGNPWAIDRVDGLLDQLDSARAAQCGGRLDYPGTVEAAEGWSEALIDGLAEITRVWCGSDPGSGGEWCLEGDGRLGRWAGDLSAIDGEAARLARALRRAIAQVEVGEARLAATLAAHHGAVERLAGAPTAGAPLDLPESEWVPVIDAAAALDAGAAPVESVRCGVTACTLGRWTSRMRERLASRWTIRRPLEPLEPFESAPAAFGTLLDSFVDPPGHASMAERAMQIARAALASRAPLPAESTEPGPIALAPGWARFTAALNVLRQAHPDLASHLPDPFVVWRAVDDLEYAVSETSRLEHLHVAAEGSRRAIEAALVFGVAEVEGRTALARARHTGWPAPDPAAPPVFDPDEVRAEAAFADARAGLCAAIRRLDLEVGGPPMLTERAAAATTPAELAEVARRCARPLAESRPEAPPPPARSSHRIGLACAALGICQPELVELDPATVWSPAVRLRDALAAQVQIAPDGRRVVVLDFDLRRLPGVDRCRARAVRFAVEVATLDPANSWPREARLASGGTLDRTGCEGEPTLILGPPVARALPIGFGHPPDAEAVPDAEVLLGAARWRLELPLEPTDDVPRVFAGLADIVLHVVTYDPPSIRRAPPVGVCAAPGASACE